MTYRISWSCPLDCFLFMPLTMNYFFIESTPKNKKNPARVGRLRFNAIWPFLTIRFRGYSLALCLAYLNATGFKGWKPTAHKSGMGAIRSVGVVFNPSRFFGNSAIVKTFSTPEGEQDKNNL